MFDTNSTAGAASDAVLCHGTSPRASDRTSHPSSHLSAENARTAALVAQTRATTAASTDASNTITESQARAALRNAAGSLRSVASALRSAATALTRAATAATNAGDGTTAGTLTTAAGAANDAADAAYTTAPDDTDAATTAATDATDAADLGAVKTALGTAAGALGTAAGHLRTAANALHNADAASTVFQLRAEVRPGDQEYILVTTLDTPILAVQFHGAIAATTVPRQHTLNAGDQHTHTITVTAPGLLTVETTGSTDTKGMLSTAAAETAKDDSSGSEDNFKIVAPVTATDYTVTVNGQTATTTGAYTLDMDFQVAMQTGLPAISTEVTVPTAPTWTGTVLAADDTELQIKPSTDEDYFLLTIDDDNSGFLTIEAKDDGTSATDAATTGTFYGPTGELAMDTNSGADSSHFRIRAPVEENKAYLMKVTGTTGLYLLEMTLHKTEGGVLLTVPSAQPTPTFDCTDTVTAGEICPPTGVGLETERYAFNIMESGALYLHTTGMTDTVGTLYGPDGRQIATDDDSGNGNNFRIAVNVNAGLHLLEVRGKTRQTRGVYGLVANFVAGPGAPVTPGTGTGDDDELTRLQDQIADLQDELDICLGEVTTDARGSLDDPNSVAPNNGYRSGVGLIRGWVCAANEVEVRIFDDAEMLVDTISTPYGSVRADTAGQCGHGRDDTGFAAQYNYNHLEPGEYTARAFADDRQIGAARTFTVVHLTEFSRNDENRFLRELPAGTCDVEDFPEDGAATRLLWEQSLQNFVIEDAG